MQADGARGSGESSLRGRVACRAGERSARVPTAVRAPTLGDRKVIRATIGECRDRSGGVLHRDRSMRLAAGAFVTIAAAGLSPLAAAVLQQQGSGAVYRVPIVGVIELGLAPFVERSLEEAQESGASAVVLDIDTPGGRVDAAERMADAISDSEVPVYAYINRRALSAGALISLAAQRIYMRPGSVIGAATPVTGEGQRAPEKIVSAMRSSMRALAEARSLDPAVAEAMVDEQIEVPGVS